MAKDTYYFSHDNNARNDEKILEFRARLGWEAYGIYWALIECLSEANDYKLALNKITGLAYSYNIDITLLQKIIDTCFELKLLTKNTHYFWSKSLLGRMELKKEKFIKRSEAGKKGMKARWGGESKNNIVITKNNTVITSKVKERKVNKSNNIIQNSKLFYDNEIKNNSDEKYIDKYKLLVKYLFGDNELKKPAEHILKIENQLTYEQYRKLYIKAVNNNFVLKEKVDSFINDSKYSKNKKSIYLTLNNWLNRK